MTTIESAGERPEVGKQAVATQDVPRRKLPGGLRNARHARGVSQKRLALDAEIDQSHLCAIERGRGGPPSPSLLARLVSALKLDANGIDALRQAALHDAVIQRIADEQGTRGAGLVSAALEAGWRLAPLELKGAEDYLRGLLRGRDALDEAQSRGREAQGKEAPMD